jgi:hypothetical protein
VRGADREERCYIATVILRWGMHINNRSIAPATPQQHHVRHHSAISAAVVFALCSQYAPPIDPYEQYNPLPLHCLPAATNLLYSQ